VDPRICTVRHASTRTDDLGFAAFSHPIDNSPIVSGTITYRREVFYPILAWGDVSSDDAGLKLITHGLQGLGGTGTLNLMLVRDVSDGGRPTSEGVKDRAYHTLRYAYLPHVGNVAAAATWRAAYGIQPATHSSLARRRSASTPIAVHGSTEPLPSGFRRPHVAAHI
jgi:hypothetical protein